MQSIKLEKKVSSSIMQKFRKKQEIDLLIYLIDDQCYNERNKDVHA